MPPRHALPQQAGKLAPSVEDVLHLEKRWHTLPGASSGSVALEDAAALLGAEVLAVRHPFLAFTCCCPGYGPALPVHCSSLHGCQAVHPNCAFFLPILHHLPERRANRSSLW